MAEPRACQSPCRNFLPVGKDEFTGAAPRAVPTNDSGTLTLTPVVLGAPTPAPVPPPALAKLVAKYTDADLQRATKLAIKLFVQDQQQAQSQAAPPAPKPRERPLKAWFPDLYYDNLHMDCYRFCQQCKDYFKTVKAKGPNKIPFADLLLHGSVTQQELQHKRRHDRATPMTWQEFKNFLQKNLEDSRSFVDSIWSKIKRDSQYPHKSVYDWTAHLEYLQSILIEFDPDFTPEEGTMI